MSEFDKLFDYHALQFMAKGKVSLAYDDDAYELSGSWAWPAFPEPVIRSHESPRGASWDHRYIAFEGPGVAV